MDVAIGPDQRGDLDAVAADIAREIAEDREARDDRQFGRRLRPRRAAESSEKARGSAA